jgi:hypothetical protein
MVLGMSRQYVAPATFQSYDEFAASARPWDLQAEMAGQRSLLVEFRQSLEASGAEKAQEFLNAVSSDVAMALRMSRVRWPDIPDDFLEGIEPDLINIVRVAFTAVYPVSTRLTAKDAETMSRLYRGIVESAEKYRRIYDGVTIGLDIDESLEKMFVDFVARHILPHISVRDRMAVANAVMQFLPQVKAQTIVDVPYLSAAS